MKRPRPGHLYLGRLPGFLTFSLLVSLVQSCQENAPDSPELNLRAPVGLTVAFLNEITVAVEWIDPNDYSTMNRRDVRYEVQLSADGLLFERVSVTSSDSTRTVIIRGFAEDSTYHFRVRILANDAASPFSLVRSLAPPPRARISLTVTAVSETTVTLNWSGGSGSAVKTIIERKMGEGGTFIRVDSVDAGVVSSVVRGPYYAHTTYYFRLQTISDLQVRSYSDTATAVLSFPEPYSFQVSLFADTAVSLTWGHNNPYAHTIVVEYFRSQGGLVAWALLASVDANESGCVLPGHFVVGWNYRFRAYLLSNYNQSSFSSSQPTRVINLWAPSQLRVTDLSPSSIEFAWNDVNTFETAFELRQDSGGGYVSVGTYPANATSAVLTFERDTTVSYDYRLNARSTYNASPLSNAVRVRFDQGSGAWLWEIP